MLGSKKETNDVAKAAMNEIRGILFSPINGLAWPNQLAAKVSVRFMVMLSLWGGHATKPGL